jgi:hypothetical protein
MDYHDCLLGTSDEFGSQQISEGLTRLPDCYCAWYQHSQMVQQPQWPPLCSLKRANSHLQWEVLSSHPSGYHLLDITLPFLELAPSN